MVAKASKSSGSSKAPASGGEARQGSVHLQKPVAKEATPGLREKTCATCGVTFHLTPDQKFFLCPECYAREYRRSPRVPPKGTQVLTQITCVECGTKEYLQFVPQDPAQALCKACFSRRRREQMPSQRHSFPR